MVLGSCQGATPDDRHSSDAPAAPQRGQVVAWQKGHISFFISHQWLHFQCPDPDGRQLRLLRQALEALMLGGLEVQLRRTRSKRAQHFARPLCGVIIFNTTVALRRALF